MWDPESDVKFANNEPRGPFFKASQINIFNEDYRGDGVQHVALTVKDILTAVRGDARRAGVPFMPTPGTLLRHAARAHREAAASSKIDEDIDDARASCEILVDGDKEHSYMLQIFMKDAAGLYKDAEAGPFFYEIIQRKGDQGFGARQLPRAVREHRARAEGRGTDLGHARAAASSGRSRGSTTSSCADAEGRAPMYEECFTRDGFEGPYTIALPPAARRTRSGWRRRSTAGRAPRRRAGAPLAKRHYKTQRAAARRAARRWTRASPLLFNADVTLGVVFPTEPDPVYFTNGDARRAVLHPRRAAGTLRIAARRRALRAGATTCSCRAGCCTGSSRTRAWRSTGCGWSCNGGLHLPQAVAQRGGAAADGRAVLPPRLQASGVHAGRRTRASATWW